MRRRQGLSLDEDATPLAGWMYADLLLALMIIFLATISFVPKWSNTSNAVTSEIKQISSGYNYNKGLSLVYSTYNPTAISEDIAAFKLKEGLPGSAEIIYAQILGGFDVKTESADAGRIRALKFSLALSKDPSQMMKSAATDIGSSILLNPTEVAVRLTFVAKIK
ncbi:unannotated protein [freshwater metagenome]|uniref:Unannotated protein n=1 Tax=freshwater metagenome TaxID=449393 RepID=A0A6J7DZ32_9ZZZZ|nr:hypothetical protein [Actinomycetota bacterium]